MNGQITPPKVVGLTSPSPGRGVTPPIGPCEDHVRCLALFTASPQTSVSMLTSAVAANV